VCGFYQRQGVSLKKSIDSCVKKSTCFSISVFGFFLIHPAFALEFTRHFEFTNGNEATLEYSMDDDGVQLDINFIDNAANAKPKGIFSDWGRFELLGQRDTRNPSHTVSTSPQFRIPSLIQSKQSFFWVRNLSEKVNYYFFEDGNVAHSCSKDWTSSRATLLHHKGKTFLLESVKKGERGSVYLSKGLEGDDCVQLGSEFLASLHEEGATQVSSAGILKVNGIPHLYDLNCSTILHPLSERPEYAIKTCEQESYPTGTFLIRLKDQKEIKLDEKIWADGRIGSSFHVENGIFETSAPKKKRIDLDQFDNELRRLLRLSQGDVILDENNKRTDGVAVVRSKYTDLVSDSLAHPHLYPEKTEASASNHLSEALWSRRSAILLGRPGTGKSSAVRAFARDVGLGLVRGVPRTTEIFEIKVTSLLSGTRYVGTTEQRISELLSAAKQSGCIYFIDEFHTLSGSGTSSSDPNDVTQFFKKALEAGELQLIGTDTHHEFYNAFAHDPAFVERFEVVKLTPPQGEELKDVIKNRFLSEFKIELTPELIESAIELSQNFDVTAAQPRSSVNLIRKAFARMASSGREGQLFDLPFLKETAVVKYGFDPFQLDRNKLRGQLLQLKEGLDAALIGQDEATSTIYNLWLRKLTGVGDPNQVNSVLLAGPPGVGKTRLAELSADLMGHQKTIIEMNKFSHSGVESFRREVYQALLQHPFRVIILDEIEKAHLSVQEAALSMLQTGAFQVTEEMPMSKKVVRDVTAKHALFILTSNAASNYIKRELSQSGAIETSELKAKLAEDGISEMILSRIQHIAPMTTPTQAEFKKGLIKSLTLTLAREAKRHGVGFVLENQDAFITEVMADFDEQTDYRDIQKYISGIEDLIAQGLVNQAAGSTTEIKLRWGTSSKKRRRSMPAAHLSLYS
jgi:replication-associated recombination protein RarA